MNFLIGNKVYKGQSALEVVEALKSDLPGDRSKRFTWRQFLLWSLLQLRDRIPLRELDVSDRLNHETVALNYLYLRHEYDAGKFTDRR